jgi:hypothetical protein
MLPEPCECGSGLLLSLPDDLFSVVSRSLSPRDLCNLSLCCRGLSALLASEKVWLIQCEMMCVVPGRHLVEWRMGVSSYKALCRFLICIQPLMGIWVHQNPELGNVVYVMPGFLSAVGCRIIPQELGPLGIEDGPILWAPVFEVVGNLDGSAAFFLHGRENGHDYLYPGSIKPVERTCNVLLLEVGARQQENECKLLHSKSFVHYSDKDLRKVCRSSSGISRSQRVLGKNEVKVPFSRLAFNDRRKLLSIVTSQIRQRLPPDSANGPLFPQLRDDEDSFQKDLVFLMERRSLLMQMCELDGHQIDWKASPELPSDPNQLELSQIIKSLDRPSGSCNSMNDDHEDAKCTRKKTLGRYFRDSLKQILGRSSSINGGAAISKNGSSSSETKHAHLHEFLRSGDAIKLTLHATTVKLSSYRAWPNMHDNSRFALYKLPVRVTTADHEYAGLWGGTFGWPPGRPTKDKPRKALFFLLLSYEESQEQRHLIATKILEGTHYVLHPNGSAMFIVNMDEPSLEPFPWDSDVDSPPVNVKQAFMGEGIANGYGFRYPGAKPGSLFAFQNGLLAFIWKESRAVLTLQRLNLQELLKKGERVPALPPIANFSYLTRSYSNVFAGFSNPSTCLRSTRFGLPLR